MIENCKITDAGIKEFFSAFKDKDKDKGKTGEKYPINLRLKIKLETLNLGSII